MIDGDEDDDNGVVPNEPNEEDKNDDAEGEDAKEPKTLASGCGNCPCDDAEADVIPKTDVRTEGENL